MRRARTETQSTNQIPTVTFEVQICQTRQACWVYTWDRERAQFRVQGIEPEQRDLPADLAVLRLEQQQEVPVYVLASQSIMPGASVPVRLLGGFQAPHHHAGEGDALHLADRREEARHFYFGSGSLCGEANSDRGPAFVRRECRGVAHKGDQIRGRRFEPRHRVAMLFTEHGDLFRASVRRFYWRPHLFEKCGDPCVKKIFPGRVS